jgi:hypothetical protein
MQSRGGRGNGTSRSSGGPSLGHGDGAGGRAHGGWQRTTPRPFPRGPVATRPEAAPDGAVDGPSIAVCRCGAPRPSRPSRYTRLPQPARPSLCTPPAACPSHCTPRPACPTPIAACLAAIDRREWLRYNVCDRGQRRFYPWLAV